MRRAYASHACRAVATVAAALAAGPALAARYRDGDWGILFVFATLPYALIPIGLAVLLAAFGAFRRSAVRAAFMLAAVLVASFFLLFAFVAPGGAASTIIASAEILVVLGLTLLPPWLQKARPGEAAAAPGPSEPQG